MAEPRAKYHGVLPKDHPLSDAFQNQWGLAVGVEELKRQGISPEQFMLGRDPAEEGAIFEDAPSLLFIRKHKPEPGPEVPMSGSYLDPKEA